MIDKIVETLLAAQSTAQVLGAMVVACLIAIAWQAKRSRADVNVLRDSHAAQTTTLTNELKEMRVMATHDRQLLADVLKQQTAAILSQVSSRRDKKPGEPEV